MSWFPRTLGVITAAYGLSTLVRPRIFAGPAGLAEGEPPAPVSMLVRAVGSGTSRTASQWRSPRPEPR